MEKKSISNKIISILLAVAMIVACVNLPVLFTDAAETNDAIVTSKQAKWTSENTIQITLEESKNATTTKPRLLFVGTLCGAHGLAPDCNQSDPWTTPGSDFDTVIQSLQASAQFGIVDYILFKTDSSLSTVGGPFYGTIDMDASYATIKAALKKQVTSFSTGSHSAVYDFAKVLKNATLGTGTGSSITDLYDGGKYDKTVHYDYIVMEFDGMRMGHFDDSKKTVDTASLNAAATVLKDYYAEDKVAWIVPTFDSHSETVYPCTYTTSGSTSQIKTSKTGKDVFMYNDMFLDNDVSGLKSGSSISTSQKNYRKNTRLCIKLLAPEDLVDGEVPDIKVFNDDGKTINENNFPTLKERLETESGEGIWVYYNNAEDVFNFLEKKLGQFFVKIDDTVTAGLTVTECYGEYKEIDSSTGNPTGNWIKITDSEKCTITKTGGASATEATNVSATFSLKKIYGDTYNVLDGNSVRLVINCSVETDTTKENCPFTEENGYKIETNIGDADFTYRSGTTLQVSNESSPKLSVGLTIDAEGYSGKYDGTTHSVTAVPSDTEGTTLSYSTDGGQTWSTEEPSIKDAGKITVTVKAENSNYNVAATKTYDLEVTKRSVKLTSASDTKTYDETPLTNGNVAESGDGFVEGEGATYNVTGSQTSVGKSANTFTYTLKQGTKPDNYEITTEEGTLSVTTSNKLTLTATDYSGKYDGASHTGTVTPSVTDGTTLSYSTDGGQTWSTEEPSIKDAGKITVTVKAENPNYETVTKEYTLEVTKRTVKLTSASDTKTYDETPLTNGNVAESGDGFIEGEGATYNVNGSQTNVGKSANTFTYTLKPGTYSDNYEISTEEGTLSVTSANSLEIYGGEDLEIKYDGQEHELGVVPSIEEGTTVTYSTDGGQTWTTEAPSIQDCDELNIIAKAENPNYETVTKEYTAKITKRAVKLTSASDTKTYDETPLTNGNVAESGDGFIEGEGATYDVTGSQTSVGKSANTFTYTLKQGTNPDNYEISTEEGTLSVTSANSLEIIGNVDYEEIYDGEEHSTIVTANKPEDSTVYYSTDDGESWTTVPPTIKDKGETVVKVKIENPNYETVTGEFILKVNARSITIKSGSNVNVYDGTPVTNANIAVEGDGFVEGEGATYNVTGSQTNVGESDNEFTYELTPGTNADNYEITIEKGKLKVTPAEFSVEGTSFSGEYDGKPHGESATSNVPEGTTITYSIDGGITWVSDFPQITEVGIITVLVKAENPNYNTVTSQYVLEITEVEEQKPTGDAMPNGAVTAAVCAIMLLLTVCKIRRKKEF